MILKGRYIQWEKKAKVVFNKRDLIFCDIPVYTVRCMCDENKEHAGMNLESAPL